MTCQLKKIYIAFSLLLVTPAYSYATTADTNFYAQALQAESKGNHELAISHYLVSAKKGVSDAKLALARIYQNTYGNDQEHIKWLLEAAQEGNVLAQYELGMTYQKGSAAVTSNLQEAQKWLTLAANDGKYGLAAYELFKISSNNNEIDQAKTWLLNAAEKGIYEAMEQLQEAYQLGESGFTINTEKSLYWQQQVLNSQEKNTDEE